GEERVKVNGEKAHSTQKPEALLYRIIISTSNAGDVVLDPFMGSGTTGAMARKLGRDFIGIEKEDLYIRIANERIDKVRPYHEQALLCPLEEKKPKVPFGSLIEKGYIEAGETLYSNNRKFTARVLANGTIVSDDLSGSIHSVSAKLIGKNNNNGWTFWYVDRGEKMVSINELRAGYIKKEFGS
ncbi:MAG: site-specific DNA-methyltransferase, partial [Candidatus Thermoplasmatota archaeon]|nr:site-specific DNA-methyltransferase [Candidatus Thermoplasmatota archaeon]